MSKNLNLIYSSPEKLNFFSSLKTIKALVLEFKSQEDINTFGEEDEREVGRSSTYAVFPELQQRVDEKQKITLDALREGLNSRGVVNPFFQNKLMAMLLQSKAGIHFPLANILNQLFLENDHPFLMDSQSYEVKFKVKNQNHVQLVFTGTWQDTTTEPHKDALKAQIEIDITPERIALYNFNVTQIAKTPQVAQAFKFLEDNQISILQKIITFLQSRFNVNKELELESATEDQRPGQQNIETADENDPKSPTPK